MFIAIGRDDQRIVAKHTKVERQSAHDYGLQKGRAIRNLWLTACHSDRSEESFSAVRASSNSNGASWSGLIVVDDVLC